MSDKKKNPIRINLRGVDGSKIDVKRPNSNTDPKEFRNNMLRSLANLFGGRAGYRQGGKNQTKPELFVPKKQDAEKGNAGRLEPVPTHLAKLWDYWLQQCHDTKSSFKNIKEVFKDMDYMYYNCTIYSRSVELYAEETVQQDSQENLIEVYAPDEKIEEEIVNLFNDLKLPSMLKETARSIVHKGNACWQINTKQGKGVIDVTPLKVEALVDRIEFSPLEVDIALFRNQGIVNLIQNNFRLKNLIQTIEDMEDYSVIFKRYLLGYQINNLMVPPWNVLHFRNKSLDTAFDPWGMPLMLNCVAPFRMYDAALTMQVIARGAKFPFEKYSLSMPNSMNPTEMLESLLEFAQEYENSGLAEARAARQDFSVSSKIYTIKELFDFELVETKQNFDDIADVELHKDNLIIGTGVPRNFYDPNNGTFGNSGIALMQQYKPFGRQVFNIQKSILEEVTLLVKIHFIFKGIDPNTEFELSMPFPQSQENADVLTNKTTMLTFANSVLDALKINVLGDQTAILPPDLVARVYDMTLPFEKDEIEKWVKVAVEAQKKLAKAAAGENAGIQGGGAGGSMAMGGAPAGGGGGMEGSPVGGEEPLAAGGETPPPAGGELLMASIEKKYDKYRSLLTEHAIKKVDFNLRKRRNYYEGLRRGRHYVHSYGVATPFDTSAVFFKETDDKDRAKIKRLKESDTNKLLSEVSTRFAQYSGKINELKSDKPMQKDNAKEPDDKDKLKESRKFR